MAQDAAAGRQARGARVTSAEIAELCGIARGHLFVWLCNVRDIDCLIAIVSVIRPGAANGAKKTQFARRAQGLEPVEYAHPSLESVLRSTFGVVAYEEHILQICEAFAGLPAGRADVLRRALVKAKLATIEEIGAEFVAAAHALDRKDEDIACVWELVAGFQGYAFCRAHSTAYGSSQRSKTAVP